MRVHDILIRGSYRERDVQLHSLNLHCTVDDIASSYTKELCSLWCAQADKTGLD